MFPTVSLLHANVWNLKISSVMFPTDLQLSLLHANVWNPSVMFFTDLQLSLYVQMYVIWNFLV